MAKIDRNRNFQSRHILARIQRKDHWKELKIWTGLMLMRKSLVADVPKLKCLECEKMGSETLATAEIPVEQEHQEQDEQAIVPVEQEIQEQAVVPVEQQLAIVPVAKPIQLFTIPDPPAVDPETFVNLKVRCVSSCVEGVELPPTLESSECIKCDVL